jgi:hypothetical protein
MTSYIPNRPLQTVEVIRAARRTTEANSNINPQIADLHGVTFAILGFDRLCYSSVRGPAESGLRQSNNP